MASDLWRRGGWSEHYQLRHQRIRRAVHGPRLYQSVSGAGSAQRAHSATGSEVYLLAAGCGTTKLICDHRLFAVVRKQREAFLQVSNQVVDVLHADGETDQLFGHAHLFP